MATPINTALLMLSKRAESSGREKLIQTFVDVGPLFALLSTVDHQVVFGRRGTGKTHAFAYLAASREKQNDAVATVDLRSVGSSAGLYADETVPLSERATRLLVDTLAAIHDAVTTYCVERADTLNLAETGPMLDRLAEAITQVKVVGTVEQEQQTESKQSQTKGGSIAFGISDGTPNIGATIESKEIDSEATIQKVHRKGTENFYVNFGATGAAFRDVVDKLGGARLWVLLDEWSSIPLALQPYLGDLLRRSLYPLSRVTVKIAAIEHRSVFLMRQRAGDYLGIELGADAAADVNLDDFMVFDNDPVRAKEFFQDLVGRHVQAVVADTDLAEQLPTTSSAIMQEAFTEKRAVEEFVRACEGVPRDAINILALAAQRALTAAISVNHIRIAARTWYQRDKEQAVSADENAHRLLHSIIDDVIGERKARAFLLRSDAKSTLIDSLYDARLLHILKRGVSTHDQPGVRFDVYKLDYGCYVDLLTTQHAPIGLLPADEGESAYVDVPPDDYRSIRRAILDLKKAVDKAATPESRDSSS
jgi:hypothetical protein